MAEQYANFGTQTLLAGLAGTSTTTTWTVTTGAGYPATTPFHVTIDNEICLVTASTFASSTFTMSGSRGQESTTVATHTTGATVLHALTAGAMNQIRTDIWSYGPIASLPGTAGQITGNRYKCSDSPYEYVFNGVGWDAWAFGFKVTEPILANFTQVKFDKSTFVTTNGGIFWSVPGNSSAEDVQIIGQTNTFTGSYFVDAGFYGWGGLGSSTLANGGFGVGLAASLSTATLPKSSFVTYGNEGSTGPYVWAKYYPTPTSGPTDLSGKSAFFNSGPIIWMRMKDDGTTNRTYYIAGDPYFNSPLQVYQEARTTNYTPTAGIFAITPFNFQTAIHLIHFSIHT